MSLKYLLFASQEIDNLTSGHAKNLSDCIITNHRGKHKNEQDI